jgi:archaellum component FlaC
VSEAVTNELIYAVLQRMQGDMSDVKNDIGDLKLRMSAVEDHLATVIVSITGLNHRMDRFDERFGRVERRLDLTDAK